MTSKVEPFYIFQLASSLVTDARLAIFSLGHWPTHNFTYTKSKKAKTNSHFLGILGQPHQWHIMSLLVHLIID